MRTYYVELQGAALVHGRTMVGVEDILDEHGNPNDAAMENEASRLALQDAADARIDWEDTDEVGDVEVTQIILDVDE